MADPLLVALISGFFGAFLGGAGQALQARYVAFKESKTVAASIRAELTALQELLQRREYIVSLDAITARLSLHDYVPTPQDVFNIDITQDYFQEFNVHCPKLGLLGDAAPPVVAVYTIAKAAVEDVRTLNKVASQERPLDRA